MRNVYINQFNSASARNLIPLAASQLYAYARSLPEITDHYDLHLEIMRNSPENIVSKYDDPKVLAFACYFWNFNQSLEVAKLAKEKYPDCLVVIGGPSVPIQEKDVREFYEQHPFVDVIVGGEGEVLFIEILKAVSENKDLSEIAGICVKKPSGETVIRPKGEYIKDLSIFPSPYLDGTFDHLLKEYGSELSGVVFESNRGCPFTCSFCFWGGPFSKIVQFPMDRVMKELEWISKNKISYVFGADANFGILNRDLDIAKKMGELHKSTGYPKYLVINWTKNATDKIIDITHALHEGGIQFMLTTSIQSHNPETLKAIKRSNIRLETFQKILDKAVENNFHAYSELILGLPLETYETFREGIVKTLTGNINYHINIYACILIPGTEMADPEYIKRYDIETRKCKLHFARTTDVNLTVPEYQDIVVSNSTMPVDQWKKAYTFGFFTKALYGLRSAFFILVYLKKEYDIEYGEFLEHVIEEGHDHKKYPAISYALSVLGNSHDSILNNGSETINLDWVGPALHPEIACLVSLLRDKRGFYRDLFGMIDSYAKLKSLKIREDEIKDVFAYQIGMTPEWNGPNNHSVLFQHNVDNYFDYSYIQSDQKMQNSRKVCLKFTKGEEYDGVDDFMKKTLYGGMIFYLSSVDPEKKENSAISASELFDQYVMDKKAEQP